MVQTQNGAVLRRNRKHLQAMPLQPDSIGCSEPQGGRNSGPPVAETVHLNNPAVAPAAPEKATPVVTSSGRVVKTPTQYLD